MLLQRNILDQQSVNDFWASILDNWNAIEWF